MTNGVGICVNDCPSTNSSFYSKRPNDYYCLDSITALGYSELEMSTYISNFCMVKGQFSFTSNCGCMLKLASKSVMNRCTLTASTYRDHFASQAVKQYLINFFADVLQARGIIFGVGFGLALLLGFLWMFVLHLEWLSHLVIWTIIFVVEALLIVLTALAYTTGQRWKMEQPQVHNIDEVHFVFVFYTSPANESSFVLILIF